MPFVQVGTYPTRNFATLGPLSLRPPFTGASIRSFALRLTSPFDLPAPVGRQPYRSFSEIPESPRCVPDSAKLFEKRMHFVREKRDKPPAGAFMRKKD